MSATEPVEATRFLERLDPRPDASFTFQTFDDNIERKDRSFARIFHGTFEEHAAELRRLNDLGAGVFVTVNKTDGEGRKKENVLMIRSVFADLDGAPLEPVQQCELAPHMIVESSPDKWHAYWFVADLKLDDFTPLQKALATRFDADPSVHDLSRVMRLPGFKHRKGDPHLVKIIGESDHDPFSAAEILEAFPPITEDRFPTSPDDAPKQNSGKEPAFQLPETIPEGGEPYGGRNVTLYKYGCSLRAKGGDDDKLGKELRCVNADRCKPPMPDDELTDLIKRVCKQPVGSPIPKWVEEMNECHAVVNEAGKTLVLNTRDLDPSTGRHVLSRSSFQDFRNRYCNEYVVTGYDNNGNPKLAPKGDAWLKHPARKQYKGITFAPCKDTPGYYNMWRGYSVKPEPGDCSLFLEHLLNTLCQGNKEHFDYLLSWMALTIQHPDRVPEVAIVLLGQRGTGKGVFANQFGSLMHEHFFAVSNPEHAMGRFNAHLQDTVILFFDEAVWAGDKRGEGTLKQLITESSIPIEAKYHNTIMAKNYCHLIIASNEAWGIPAGVDERRFFALEVSNAHQKDYAYFAAITKQMEDGGRAALLHDLLEMDLSTFNHRAAPNTEALREQKQQSFNPKEAWWFEALWNGEIVPDRPDEGWQTDLAKEDVFSAYLKHAGDAVTTSYRGTETVVGIFFKKNLPPGWPLKIKIEKEMSVWEVDEDGRNSKKQVFKDVPGWKFPDLNTCREKWDERMQQTTNWPKEQDEPMRQTSERPEQDEIPF